MGGEAKMTVMVLKVDLGCKKCYRKIKKVLCSTPQIRDQLFDEKSNTVTITVICCSPENVADKIRSKAGGTIKGLDIKPTQSPGKPPGDKPKDGGGPPQQMKQGPPPAASQPKPAPPPADKPKSAPPQGNIGGGGGGGNGEKPKPPQFPMAPPPMQAAPRPNQPSAFMSPETIPVAGYPSIFPPVVYYDGGPYYQNQGISTPQRFPQHHQPVYQYDGYTGRPVGAYFTEDNPSTCSVM